MAQGFVQIALFLLVLTAMVPLVGGYIAKVFRGEKVFLTSVVGPFERFSYRVLRVRPDDGQDWKA
jgi:potassium-transporting ATPase potassium-binding subunit